MGMTMQKIALTGPSGAGKGYVSALLVKKGYPVLDTDALVHTLYQGGVLPLQIAKLFGEDVLTESKSVNRGALREIVFSDPQALKKLNLLVHEVVREKVALWLEQKCLEGHALAFVDAPQLFEANMQGDFDYTVAVTAEEDVRLQRICARDGIDEHTAKQRMKNQMTSEQYRQRCDYTIQNDVNTDPEERIDTLINTILK
jgi:dephospho-CoA kinase